MYLGFSVYTCKVPLTELFSDKVINPENASQPNPHISCPVFYSFFFSYRIVVLLKRMQLPLALAWSVPATTLIDPSAIALSATTFVTTTAVVLTTLCTPLLALPGSWSHRCRILPLRPLSGMSSLLPAP